MGGVNNTKKYKMEHETKIKLIEAGRHDLLEIHEINQAGYAGCLPNGNIVDRRLFPDAYPVRENSLLGIPKSQKLNPKTYQIWSEGYRATGESAGATCLNRGILANSFDDAVTKHIAQLKPEDAKYYNKSTPANYVNAEAFLNRRSNWDMWGCALFDNEADARKTCG